MRIPVRVMPGVSHAALISMMNMIWESQDAQLSDVQFLEEDYKSRARTDDDKILRKETRQNVMQKARTRP